MILFVDEFAGFSPQLIAWWNDAWDIWQKGGWAMAAIALNAAILFSFGVHIWLKLANKGYQRVSEKAWRMWVAHADYREGKLGRLMDAATRAESLESMATTFDNLRQTELARTSRNLKVMRVCIAAAPLLGLLGTVTGMLATFAALADGQGGDETMAAVSQGISEALITTMTGLVVALPGMFFQYVLRRKRDLYASFLTHVETVCTQDLYRRLRTKEQAA